MLRVPQGRRLALLSAAALAAVALSGCASRPPPPCDWPAAGRYAGLADSLGLPEYLALPAAVRDDRRAEAAHWRRTRGRDGAVRHLRALRTIAGLVPDDAGAWLDLAETLRWLGDRASALTALDAAAAAWPLAPEPQRRSLRVRAALCRAWLHRDRGEWLPGLALVDSALAVAPRDREAILLQGLLRGLHGEHTGALLVAGDIERANPFLSDWVWIRGVASLGIDELPEAYHWLGGRSAVPIVRSQGNLRPEQTRRVGDPLEFGRHTATPDGLHRADYWRDLGLVCERMGRLEDATRYYGESAASVPVRDDACLARLDLPLRENDLQAATLPVWVAGDRFLVTGSAWAWGLECARRFESAPAPAAAAFWSDAAVGALTTCLRAGLEPVLARALRGRVYAQLDAPGLAEADLTRALDGFRAGGEADPATLYWLGYLRIKAERSVEAVPLLREALAADPGFARACSALGYALVMAGDLDAARDALDRAVALDPGQTAAWYNRGLMHFNAGRWEEAVLDLRRAAELAPENPDVDGLLQRAVLQLQRTRAEGRTTP